MPMGRAAAAPRSSVLPIVVGAAMLIVVAGVAVVASLGSGRGGLSSEHLQWNSWAGRPVPVDVDDDGTVDFVGWIKLLNRPDGEQCFFVAVNGKSGEEIWRTSSLGSQETATHTRGMVADARLVLVDGDGDALAFSLKNGKRKWKKSLGERAKRMCEHDDGVLVELADESRVILDTGSGKRTDAGSATCRGGWGTHTTPNDVGVFDRFNSRTFDSRNHPKVEGMYVSDSFVGPDGVTIALGTKDKGTRLPMVAVVKGGAELWQSVVPDDDAMKAQKVAPDVAAADEDRVYVAFDAEGNGAVRIVAFDLESGKRRWERDAPHSDEHSDVTALVPAGNRIAVSHWTWLTVLSAKNGKEKFTVGRWM